jgi:hypothetical protein
MGLVTLEVAKDHLKPPGDIDDVRIERLIDEASAVVLQHLKLEFDAYQNTDGSPDPLLVPPNVRAAMLLVLGTLYDNADAAADPLSAGVKALLHSRRTPTLR